MSDGALSQAEIDALLSGGGDAGASAPMGGGGINAAALKTFFGGTVDPLSSNLSTMTGGTVTFSAPEVTETGRDAFLGTLPDTVCAVKIDFTSGFPGDHLFLMGEDTAKTIAALMNKEENPELDDMAMSVIGESVSQMTGTIITALTNKTGNKSIASGSPQAAAVPKATAALPGGNFAAIAYTVNINGNEQKIWEVLGESAAEAISTALTAPPPSSAPKPSMGMGGMGGAPGAGITGGFGSTPSMQGVQFPSLNANMGMREQGNIGLLMDVNMEMTVELGRTRKLIKEILSMGEGTIIELDKLAGEPVDILVNHKLIAKGEVVVIDENFGVRVTEIVSPAERMPDM